MATEIGYTRNGDKVEWLPDKRVGKRMAVTSTTKDKAYLEIYNEFWDKIRWNN